jgi:hypothetical protein
MTAFQVAVSILCCLAGELFALWLFRPRARAVREAPTERKRPALKIAS